jgi:hypothetical protein
VVPVDRRRPACADRAAPGRVPGRGARAAAPPARPHVALVAVRRAPAGPPGPDRRAGHGEPGRAPPGPEPRAQVRAAAPGGRGGRGGAVTSTGAGGSHDLGGAEVRRQERHDRGGHTRGHCDRVPGLDGGGLDTGELAAVLERWSGECDSSQWDGIYH